MSLNRQVAEVSASSPTHRSGLNARALDRAQRYIREHLCERMSLEDLARAACMSRFHFARQFRASTGKSPMEYVLHSRVELAKQVLQHGKQNLCITANALGFYDQSHFTRTFRRLTGVPPRKYLSLRSAAPGSFEARHDSATPFPPTTTGVPHG